MPHCPLQSHYQQTTQQTWQHSRGRQNCRVAAVTTANAVTTAATSSSSTTQCCRRLGASIASNLWGLLHLTGQGNHVAAQSLTLARCWPVLACPAASAMACGAMLALARFWSVVKDTCGISSHTNESQCLQHLDAKQHSKLMGCSFATAPACPLHSSLQERPCAADPDQCNSPQLPCAA